MEHLFRGLSNAVSYFGGVAEISKTDNMRQWIRKTDRYEPTLNEAASQWCLHYGTELDECRSRKPRDKGPAESLVNQYKSEQGQSALTFLILKVAKRDAPILYSPLLLR